MSIILFEILDKLILKKSLVKLIFAYKITFPFSKYKKVYNPLIFMYPTSLGMKELTLRTCLKNVFY